MSNLLTIHILNTIPWSNLNRDDTGTPKRLIQGEVQRGQLSSQSIKRAARTGYENASKDISIRSGNLEGIVTKRVLELNQEMNPKAVEKAAKKAIGGLTKSADANANSGGGAAEASRSTWLSAEEIEACAQAIAQGDDSDFIQAGKTGSLAIAAFGRMFASEPGKNTEAAIAVSPAVSTHRVIIETDYYSTGDDAPRENQGAGATFLGMALYTNGCFYRSVTIDKAQLQISWTGFDREDSDMNLGAMIDALIFGLPRGKKNSTAPYVMPPLILAEEQAHRVAYDFETPVQAGSSGGYLESTVKELASQFKAARKFDAANFEGLCLLSGAWEGLHSDTQENPILSDFGVEYRNKAEFIKAVIDWIKSRDGR